MTPQFASTQEGPSAAPDGAAPERLAQVTGLAFDLDGTVYLGAQLLPGARDLLDALASAGLPFLFATNNSSKSAEEYLVRLHALGLPADRERLLTSNDVAIERLRQAGLRRPYLVATPTVVREYRSQGIDPAEDDADTPDCVLLTFDTTLTYAKLRRASDLVRAGLPYLATHPDTVCPTPEGPIPDCGAFIALLAETTGARPEVLGKPQPPMATAIEARLDLPAHRIAFVGDRLYTDVRMAVEHGFVAVLTLTGEAQRTDLPASPHQPDVVVESLTALHTLLRRQGTLP